MLKSHRQVRDDKGIDLVQKKDSKYADFEVEQKLELERSERVSMPINISKALQNDLPFKSKAKVTNSREAEHARRRTNLLEKLGLPTKRPFKKAFLNDEDKQVYSLV